jgi:hypothetical protein
MELLAIDLLNPNPNPHPNPIGEWTGVDGASGDRFAEKVEPHELSTQSQE